MRIKAAAIVSSKSSKRGSQPHSREGSNSRATGTRQTTQSAEIMKPVIEKSAIYEEKDVASVISIDCHDKVQEMFDDVQKVAWGESSSIYIDTRKQPDNDNQDIQDVQSPRTTYLKQGTDEK